MLKVAWIYASPFLFSNLPPSLALEMNIHQRIRRHVDNDVDNDVDWKKIEDYNQSMMMVGKNEQQFFLWFIESGNIH
jgi:hypothetical protein